LLFLSLIGLVFWASEALPVLWGQLLGTVAAIGTGIYSIRVLNRLVGLAALPRWMQRILPVLAPRSRMVEK
jgi:hypothetical protein